MHHEDYLQALSNNQKRQIQTSLLVGANNNDGMSLKELKHNLREKLKNSSVLDTVKASVRREFINSLTGTKKKAPKDVTLRDRVTLSCVYHYLKQREYSNTTSVFAAECGIDSKSLLLSEKDIIYAMNLDKINEVRDLVQNKENKKAVASVYGDSVNYNTIFDVLIEHCSGLGRRGYMETGIQTDNTMGSINGSVDSTLDTMQHSLLSYIDRNKVESRSNIDDRIKLIEEECKAEYEKNLELRMSYYRERELIKIKQEYEDKLTAEIELLNKNLDSDYKRRLQIFQDREEQLKRESIDREKKLELKNYEIKQSLTLEIAELKQKEASVQRRIEIESTGLKLLEQRLKEVQELLEIREKDVSRREKEVGESIEMYRSDARKEAKIQLQLELELADTEKSKILLEKQQFERDKKNFDALVKEEVRKMTKELHSAVDDKDLDIQALRDKVAELHLTIKKANDEENRALLAGIDEVDSDDSVVMTKTKLVQHVSGGRQTTGSSKSSKYDQWFQNIVNKAAVGSGKVSASHMSLASAVGDFDYDTLLVELKNEKSKSSSLQMRCDELNRLVADYKQTVSRLTESLNSASHRNKEVESTEELLDSILSKKNEILLNKMSVKPSTDATPHNMPPPMYHYGFNAAYANAPPAAPYYYPPMMMPPPFVAAPVIAQPNITAPVTVQVKEPTKVVSTETAPSTVVAPIPEQQKVVETLVVEKNNQITSEAPIAVVPAAVDSVHVEQVPIVSTAIENTSKPSETRQSPPKSSPGRSPVSLTPINTSLEIKRTESSVSSSNSTASSPGVRPARLIQVAAKSPSKVDTSLHEEPVVEAIVVTSPLTSPYTLNKSSEWVEAESDRVSREKERSEAEERKRKEEEDDAAAIAEARAKVLARRKSKQTDVPVPVATTTAPVNTSIKASNQSFVTKKQLEATFDDQSDDSESYEFGHNHDADDADESDDFWS